LEKPTKYITLRFYEELNDFLPSDKNKTSYRYFYFGNPTIKDVIESEGVPHPEVDMILVNGKSVDFNYRIKKGDRISVYPVFESFDIGRITEVRSEPLRKIRFIADAHLGKLARLLRLLGFDTLFRNDFEDEEVANIGSLQERIILTRDKELLKRSNVVKGYWIRNTDSKEQAREVIRRFHLESLFKPFNRCMVCNGILDKVEKSTVIDEIPEKPREFYRDFYRCDTCHKVYWRGTHYDRLKTWIDSIN